MLFVSEMEGRLDDTIINSDVEEMVKYLQDDYHLSTIDAFDKIYNSTIYQKLLNTQTGLYLESPAYIYSYLTHIAADHRLTPAIMCKFS
ncbi:hypothetical protein PRLR5107_27850 [Prevotella lacticifex]|uniref:Uncharacterized protein n=1 Tax=Prevotella lacticifex TaxID=2854755 RepID=A0A9R1C8M9_9BACT|nr:hypothetical protein PRLR5003_30590 [Prevotella lacticifex]GJG41142.1 hypothetical protein PRLR5019_31130 [Prevotella lacticifex]GJG43385.1 hypothetical protein PRLR5025_21710 [Prevotella lacticifex]GJG47167.1 hypothetical protein PRLR5027_27620 [Prevotella lacticifex]GJG50182.1 hypothetical protein PRLR5052_25950 [Prevotella lacticifex]